MESREWFVAKGGCGHCGGETFVVRYFAGGPWRVRCAVCYTDWTAPEGGRERMDEIVRRARGTTGS